MEILWLGDPACMDARLVGGKAANLSRLAAEYRVPPGFCLSAVAYDRVESERLRAGEAAAGRETLLAALGPALGHAYRELARRCGQDEPSVAVRSSAIDEDGLGSSFAGQYETLLNVVGIDAVADAVLHCWASGQAAQVLAYRRRHGLEAEGGRMAVLVQQLVKADISAVVFSANPITGSREEVVINASWGLGESIVGGTVTPDTCTVRKANLAIISRQVAEKRRMTVRAPEGTREVDVPRLLRTEPALEDEQAKDMARLAAALEKQMGWAVDLECAYQDGELYLLQCRPVTTVTGGEPVANREPEERNDFE